MRSTVERLGARREGPARAHGRGHDGLQEGAHRGGGRHRAGDRDAACQAGKRVQDLGERVATEGTVQAYVHASAKVGVLIEVDCKTDFVATQRGLRRALPVTWPCRSPPRRRLLCLSRGVPAERAMPSRASSSCRRPISPRGAREDRRRASSTSGLRASCCSSRRRQRRKYEGKTVAASCATSWPPRPARTSSSVVSHASRWDE